MCEPGQLPCMLRDSLFMSDECHASIQILSVAFYPEQRFFDSSGGFGADRGDRQLYCLDSDDLDAGNLLPG